MTTEEKLTIPIKARIIGAIIGLGFGIGAIPYGYRPLWFPIALIAVSLVALLLNLALKKRTKAS